jgi:hypothetical protein
LMLRALQESERDCDNNKVLSSFLFVLKHKTKCALHPLGSAFKVYFYEWPLIVVRFAFVELTFFFFLFFLMDPSDIW